MYVIVFLCGMNFASTLLKLKIDTTLKYYWEMSTENRIHLKVDQYSRIGIKDVISLLKGLRSEAVIKIVQASELSSSNSQKTDTINEVGNEACYNNSTHQTFKKTPSVKGDTKLPQIRELNEIAALLRSMDMQHTQLSS